MHTPDSRAGGSPSHPSPIKPPRSSSFRKGNTICIIGLPADVNMSGLGPLRYRLTPSTTLVLRQGDITRFKGDAIVNAGECGYS